MPPQVIEAVAPPQESMMILACRSGCEVVDRRFDASQADRARDECAGVEPAIGEQLKGVLELEWAVPNRSVALK